VQDLIRFAPERIGYNASEEIEVPEEMPPNASGKVDRTRLKVMAPRDHVETGMLSIAPVTDTNYPFHKDELSGFWTG
jgi:hypothetical protein